LPEENTGSPHFGEAGFHALMGDYYVEEEHVTRGVTFNDSSFLGDFDAFGSVDPFAKPSMLPLLTEMPRQELSQDTFAREVAEPQFDDITKPPEVPFGGVASTSFNMDGVRSADAFRALYDFLRSRLGGIVTKTSVKKCSVTATIFLEEAGRVSQCEVKGRLFRVRDEHMPSESWHLVAELTRRSGDSLAFAEVFQRAAERLDSAVVRQREEDSEIVAVPPELLIAEGDCMQPLVDAVKGAASPEIQAEALAALLALTTSSAMLADLHMACASLQSILLHLAASPLLQTSYLAERLASWHVRNLDSSAVAFGECS